MDNKIFRFEQEVQDKFNSVVEDYYLSVQQTEKFWIRDNKMALKIQSLYKMHKYSQIFLRKRRATVVIQKYFRAILARKKFQEKKALDINKKNLVYFSNQARVIQKAYWGYYKRKYVHDFYARKQFLNLLQKKNQKFLDDLYKKSDEDKIEEERRQEAIARQEFNELAKNLHHLSSTYQIPGVYNPPYVSQKPTAFNIDVETHLKATFKANFKWTPPKKEDIDKFSTKKNENTQIRRPNSSTKLKPLNQTGQHSQKISQKSSNPMQQTNKSNLNQQ